MPINTRYQLENRVFRLRHQAGFGLLGWLLMIPVGIVLFLILTICFYEGRKAYWDSEVREMCEKDGGVKVYAKITIAREQYEKLPKSGGSVAILPEAHSKSDEPAFAVEKEIVLKEWAPRVARWEKLIKRRSDGKVIGILVTYYRSGGDSPISYAHPSSFSCPEQEKYYLDQANFFAVKEAVK